MTSKKYKNSYSDRIIKTNQEQILDMYEKFLKEETPQVDNNSALPNWHYKCRFKGRGDKDFRRLAFLWWETVVMVKRLCMYCIGETEEIVKNDMEYRKCENCRKIFPFQDY